LMHGKTSKTIHDGKAIFNGIGDRFTAARYHSLVLDEETIPAVLEITARSEDKAVMGIRHKPLNLEAVQFHPESYLTENGKELIANWIENCKRFEPIVV